MVRWSAHLALLWGALCLITFPTTLVEVWIWGGIAAITATVAARVLSQGRVGFRPRLRWMVRALRLPVAVLADTWLLARRLVGCTDGDSRFEGVAFPCPGEDARAVTRRALAEVSASVAPNVFVLGVDRDEEVLVVHQLVPRDDIAGDADPLNLRHEPAGGPG